MYRVKLMLASPPAISLAHPRTRRVVWLVLVLALLSCSCDNDSTKVVQPPVSLPVGHYYPAWSASGDSLYFQDIGITKINGNGSFQTDPDSAGLRIVSAAGGDTRMVFRSELFRYSLSPDGSAVCMALNGDLFIGTFINGRLDADAFSRITAIGGCASPSWGPVGDWIAFDSYYEDPRGSQAIWKVSPDGSGLTDLSVHGTGEWIMPSWHPSGSTLVHVRYVPSGTSASEIFVMDDNGKNGIRLTHNNTMDVNPQYSPDGALVCYENRSSGISTIYVMNADGSGRRSLAVGAMPAWSPVGDTIAYVSQTSSKSTNGTIWIVGVAGGGTTQVTRSRMP
jgi:Tol biopolymer transport system component